MKFKKLNIIMRLQGVKQHIIIKTWIIFALSILAYGCNIFHNLLSNQHMESKFNIMMNKSLKISLGLTVQTCNENLYNYLGLPKPKQIIEQNFVITKKRLVNTLDTGKDKNLLLFLNQLEVNILSSYNEDFKPFANSRYKYVELNFQKIFKQDKLPPLRLKNLWPYDKSINGITILKFQLSAMDKYVIQNRYCNLCRRKVNNIIHFTNCHNIPKELRLEIDTIQYQNQQELLQTIN